MTDAELMLAAAGGDESAFEELVGRFSDVLLNFFVRMGVSYSDGQDLAQRTFLRLWRYRAQYAAKAKFTTFLFILARQVSIDFFRAEGRRRNLMEGYIRELDVRGSPSSGVPLAGEDVRRAVRRLDPGGRDVVELGVFQDLPYADVAEILGIPLGTVKSRMFHALRKLKELLND